MTLDEYKKRLAFKDWYYQRSDDPKVYEQGQQEHFALLDAAKSLDPDYEIWKQHMPKATA